MTAFANDYDYYVTEINMLGKVIDDFCLTEGYTDDGMISIIIHAMYSINKGKTRKHDKFITAITKFFMSRSINDHKIWVKLLGVSLDEYLKAVSYH